MYQIAKTLAGGELDFPGDASPMHLLRCTSSRPVLSGIARTGSRTLLLLAVFLLMATAAHAKSTGCTAVPSVFPPAGTAIASGGSQIINTFAAGEVITLTQLSGISSVVAKQGDGTTIASFTSPGTYLATPITSAGTFSVTVQNTGANPVTLSAVCNAPSKFTVTVASDPATGTASNCTAGSTTDASCSLRDAIAAANALGGAAATIFFSSSVVGTITLANGPLSISTNAVINVAGPGANFLTLSGNSTSGIFSISGMANISNLGFTAANASTGAIAILGSSPVTINACSFTGNHATGSGGGAIADLSAALTVTSSTFSANTAPSGGAIALQGGSLTLNDSTLTGNTATVNGGAIYTSNTVVQMTNTTIAANQALTGGGYYATGGSLALANTAIAGNTATGVFADLDAISGLTDNGGNYYSTNGSGTSTLAPNLLPLGNYGGPLQTMLPAPLSPLLCQGIAANATTAGLTLDERNNPRTTTYGSNTCIDIGADESSYALAFVQQPTNSIVGVPIAPAPTVQWKESSIPLAVSGQAIPIAAASGTLSGTTSPVTASTGIVTYSGLSIAPAQPSDTLKATLALSTTPAISVSATSNTFNVAVPVTAFTITNLPAGATAGSAISFTVTAYNGNAVANYYTGTITISSAQDSQLAFVGGAVMYTFTSADAGSHTFTLANGAVFKTAGSDTLTVTDTGYNVAVTNPAITVNPAAPALLSAVTGSGQSAPIGGTFVLPLTVKVTDIYANPNPGVTITYTAPSTGASIAPTTATLTTAADGTASLTAIANATASATPYTVSAAAAGITTPVTFSLTNTQAASRITVAQVAPQPVSAGTGVNVPTTFVATLSDATQNSAGLPTGNVQFYIGTPLTGTPIGMPQPISNAQATITTTFNTAGSYNITAQYLGDGNFTGSTSSALVEVVLVPSYTISLNPTSLTITGGGEASTTVTITPIGNYQGTLTLNCSGLVQYAVCVFSQTAVALTGTNTPQTVTLQLFTLGPANTSALHTGHTNTRDAGLLWLPGIILAAFIAFRRRKHLRLPTLFALLLLASFIAGISGCSTTHFYTTPGTDAVSVNSIGVATPNSGSSNLNQTATLDLIVVQ
jgi:predicted outer membrane repeat protein